jgi:glutamate synthase (NADPH/NADH) small chain
MAGRLRQDRLENEFGDYKIPLNAAEAFDEAQRCIHCYGAPCIKACPTGINIPQFIKRIGAGHVKGAAKTILDSNILGLSCAQACPTEVLCEGACVYNELDGKPISIGKLQRFAVEYAYNNDIEYYKPGKPSGKRVALIGAGPASLACAHELRKHGHEAVIFEKGIVAGGLNTNGIAPYKMKAAVSLREIERVERMGVRIEYGKELGKQVTLEKLVEEYDAVFLGLGLGPDSRLDVPGADHPRVSGAVEFIARLKTGDARELSWLKQAKSALIVGGGNTALDACREMKWLDVSQVVVSYRRGEEDMSGYAHELKAARQEGVELWFHTLPTAIERAGERLNVRLARTRVEGGKVVTTGESQTLAVDLVLVATGQAKLESILGGVKGLAFEKGRLKVDPKTGRTGHGKIYAGGDLANGGMEVVNAVAEGKRAALAINHELFGEESCHG